MHTLAAAVLIFAGLTSVTATAHAPTLDARVIGGRFSVVVEGRGPDVIFIPGLASSREVWKDTADRLKATHRVHLIQLGGFAGDAAAGNAKGDVVAPFVEERVRYIDAAHIKSPTIIGHSLGGEAALMLAARHPASVSRVIVIDALPFYRLILNPAATSKSATMQAATFRDMMLATSPAQAAAMQPAVIARLVKTPMQRPAVIAASLASDRTVVARATYELMTTDLRPELPDIAAPVSIIYAYDANYGVPPDKIDVLYRNAYAQLKGTRFTRIDDSYHFVMLDQPARFQQAIDAALSVNR